MAALAKSGTPSVSTAGGPEFSSKATRAAGEAISAGDACYIKSDGLIWKSTGATATAPAQVDGFAMKDALAGEQVTICWNVRFNYGAAMVPGTPFYLSGTVAGGLDTVASTGGTKPIARAFDSTRIEVIRSLGLY